MWHVLTQTHIWMHADGHDYKQPTWARQASSWKHDCWARRNKTEPPKGQTGDYGDGKLPIHITGGAWEDKKRAPRAQTRARVRETDDGVWDWAPQIHWRFTSVHGDEVTTKKPMWGSKQVSKEERCHLCQCTFVSSCSTWKEWPRVRETPFSQEKEEEALDTFQFVRWDLFEGKEKLWSCLSRISIKWKPTHQLPLIFLLFLPDFISTSSTFFSCSSCFDLDSLIWAM